MTAFHFKCERLDEQGTKARYRFYPDHVMAPEITGEFVVDTVSWHHEITVPARAEEKGLVSMDSQCVAALVHKLQKAAGDLPNEVYFIA